MLYNYLLVLTAALVAIWLSTAVTDAAIGQWPLNGGPCPYDESDIGPCGLGCWCEDDYSYCSSPPACFDRSCYRCWPELNNFCCMKQWSGQTCGFVGFVKGSGAPCPLDMDAQGIVAAGPLTLPTGK